MQRRVLIVGTSPYDTGTPARAFDSYFHYFQKENLAQVFSASGVPMKGHCSKLYQITDKEILYRWLGKVKQTGKEFEYKDLPETSSLGTIQENSKGKKGLVSQLYTFGRNKNSFVYLARGILWRKSFWCTEKLNRWLEEFKPECVFLSFSDDYFIPQIALYVAKKFEIPIVSSIGDDYYFNYKFSFSPFYHLYKLTYRALIRKVFQYGGSAIYIGNKIRDKYNTSFGLNGETVYLTSSISRRKYKDIDSSNPAISCFGNIRLGRNESLCEIADALDLVSRKYFIDVYSNEQDEKKYSLFHKQPNIRFHGAIPYEEVKKKTVDSDILIVAEGFKKKDVDISRYSLSTKIADALASGVNVFAYGSKECGTISYAEECEAITVCTDKARLSESLRKLIFDKDYQRTNYEKAIQICKKNHTLENSCKIFENVVNNAVLQRREYYAK